MASFRNFFGNLYNKLVPRRDRAINQVTSDDNEILDPYVTNEETRDSLLSGDTELHEQLDKIIQSDDLTPDEIHQVEVELHRWQGSGGESEGTIEEEQVQDVVRSMRLNPNSRIGKIAEKTVDLWRGVQGIFRQDPHDSLASDLGKVVDRIAGTRVRPPTRVRRVSTSQGLDNLIKAGRERMAQLASRLRSRDISVTDFRNGMSAELRRLGLAAQVLGAGGPGNLSGHHSAQLDRFLSRQLSYLGRFVWQLERTLLEGGSVSARDISRAQMYAESIRPLYEESYRQMILNRYGEDAEERRVLGAGESCEDCITYAADGWRPIGTLPPIGDSVCGQYCKCTFEYSVEARGDD